MVKTWKDGRILAAELCPLPIVFLTGHGDIPTSVEAMKRGAEDFLTKPVDEDRFLVAVQGALEPNRRQLAALEEKFAGE